MKSQKKYFTYLLVLLTLVACKEETEDSSATPTESTNDTSSTTAETPSTITFGTRTSNSITISEWTSSDDVSGYVLLMNIDSTFTAPSNGDNPLSSTTYRGYDQQTIYNSSAVTSLNISLLESDRTYYFKLYTYDAGRNYTEVLDSSSTSNLSCSTSSTTDTEVCFYIDTAAGTRRVISNQWPNHTTGTFPNASVTAGEYDKTVPLKGELQSSIQWCYSSDNGYQGASNAGSYYQFGIARNGLGFRPMGLKPWEDGSGDDEWAWQAAVVNEGDTDLDAYGGHVTSDGEYHYHGDANLLASEETGSTHSQLYGFAADGFPVYYKYGYTDENDSGSSIKELKSSYRLKTGHRKSYYDSSMDTDGTDEPDGIYDGTYIQDYEYVDGLGDLDECNGRYGITPEYPEGTYYYVITSDFPKVPNCFKGDPDGAESSGFGDFVIK